MSGEGRGGREGGIARKRVLKKSMNEMGKKRQVKTHKQLSVNSLKPALLGVVVL